tara:strand:+ start:844 stop:2217 length:1374 start_codon:yes stop_codon:yes gene_type:complete
MIKTIIFDLDGVLVNTKNIHFLALNQALYKVEKYKISYQDHLRKFDGLPTNKKIDILLHDRKIKKKNRYKIYKLKQNYTSKILKNEIKYNEKIEKLFIKLSKNFKLAIATNAIKKTLDFCLKSLKIKKYIDFAISTNDLKFTKPHPEIYLKCLIKLNSRPSETLVLEDSYYGRDAAKEANCRLMPIKYLSDVNYNSIISFIKDMDKQNKIVNKNNWDDPKLNILIPMAGAGSRFEKAGYTFPKPLIEIHGKTMIQWVIESLQVKGNYIFIIRSDHQNNFNIKHLLKALVPNCKIVETDGVTEGAACTTLLAKKFINSNNPLLIANSDQFIEWNSGKTMYKFTNKNVDGGILIFKSLHPKWSYAKVDKDNYVVEVAEKKVISDNATVGVYYWKKGSDYVSSAESMIKKNIRIKNEFYVCPVYTEAINKNKKILIEEIDKMWGLGTPEDLNYFISNYKS